MLGGIDEAGRGPVFGPMVVAGVSGLYQETFKELGVRDSKLLPEPKRAALAKEIRALARRVEVLTISAEEIDRRRGDETLNEIEVTMFAIIGRRLKVDELFMDACDVDALRFGRDVARHLGATKNSARIVAEHKADVSYPIVSAASIIAKVRRDFEVAKMALPLEKKLGRPLGSGYAHDASTVRFLEEWVRKFGDLPPGTRRSWDTARVIEARALTKTLDQFDLPSALPVPSLVPRKSPVPTPARR
jgi:ribonuclease HII